MKGQLAWAEITVARLIIYGLILLGIIYMMFVFLSILASGEEDSRARSNFKLLKRHIEEAEKNGEASVVLMPPAGHAIMGFDAGRSDAISFRTPLYGSIPRPEECGTSACVCLVEHSLAVDENPFEVSPVECIKVDANIVRSTTTREELMKICPHKRCLIPNGESKLESIPYLANELPAETYEGQTVYPLIIPEQVVFLKTTMDDKALLVDFGHE